MATAQTKYPEMQWDASDLSEEFKLFKQRLELSFLDNGITDKAKQATKIKLAVGKVGLKKINNSSLTDEEQKDPKKLWKLSEEQLDVNVNFRIHRLELSTYKQQANEKIDDFVNRCRSKAASCEFTTDEVAERIIELVIASTPIQPFRKDLMDQEKGYPLTSLLAEGRKYEALQAGKQRIKDVNKDVDVNIDGIKQIKDSRNCGLDHPARKCPAYHDTCKACGAKSHWAKKCRNTKCGSSPKAHRSPNRHRRRRRSRSPSPTGRRRRMHHQHQNRKGKNMNNIQQQPDSDEEQATFYNITVSNLCIEDKRTEAYASITITCPQKTGQHNLLIKLDTGAEANTLPLRTIEQMYKDKWTDIIRPSKTKLSAYNGTNIKCLGKIDITCKGLSNKWSTQVFYVVDVSGPAVAGLPMCEDLVSHNTHNSHTSSFKHQHNYLQHC